MSHNIGISLCHEWSSTEPHCVNVVTVTLKYFKMRVRIHSTDAMMIRFPGLLLPFVHAVSVENLGMRLGVIYYVFIPNFFPYILPFCYPITFLTLVTTSLKSLLM